MSLPDMAVSSLDSSTRDVQPSARTPEEEVEQLSGSRDATDRAVEVIGLGLPGRAADERTPPMELVKKPKLSLDVPDSLTPSLEVSGKVQRGMPRRMLSAAELRMCEVYARSTGRRVERAQFVEKELQRKYGFTVTANEALQVAMSRAGKKYRKALWMKGRKIALRTLNKHVPDVVADYLWSRTAAKDQGDYKEVRLAAVDHLDRLGVTLKKDVPTAQTQVIVLQGRNYDAQTLDTPTPEVLATEILQEAEGEAI